MREPDNSVPFFSGYRLQSSFLGLDEKDLAGYRYGSSRLRGIYFDNLGQKLYYWTSKHFNLALHDYMVAYTMSILEELHYSPIPITNASNIYMKNILYRSDIIISKSCVVECETSLKSEYFTLISRLRAFYSSHIFVYVLVPNLEIKKRYKAHLHEAHLSNFSGRLFTLKEFSYSISL